MLVELQRANDPGRIQFPQLVREIIEAEIDVSVALVN
jgi:hypothetical protein